MTTARPEWAMKLAGPWVDYEHAGIAKMKAAPSRGLCADR